MREVKCAGIERGKNQEIKSSKIKFSNQVGLDALRTSASSNALDCCEAKGTVIESSLSCSSLGRTESVGRKPERRMDVRSGSTHSKH